MLIAPFALSEQKYTREELAQDREKRIKFGPCAVGPRAIYLGVYLIERFYYVPIKKVERVYKRLCVSKGFFESGKVFMTIPYLVVVYDGGKERVCRFTREEPLDAMLDYLKEHTKITVGKQKTLK